MTTGGAAHVLVFPYPAQGHMIPLLDLAHQLASHSHGALTVTVVVTPKNRPLLDPLLSQSPAIAALVLPLPASPSIPAGVENVKDMPSNSFRPMMRALGELHAPLLCWFDSHPSPPLAIISDIFLGWTHSLAVLRRIPRIVFSPSGGLALSIIYSLWRDSPQIEDPNRGGDPNGALISFPRIPNAPSYPWGQLSPVYRSHIEGDPVSEFIKDGFLANMASWGLVVNSFSELERVYLAHLREEVGHDRVWAVGPLLPPDHGDDDSERGGPSSVPSDDVFSWLDTCKDRSVLYVCFGSQAVLTNEQMEALALGLEESGVRFLWPVKGPTTGHVDGGYGALRPGFEDRAIGRGLIVKGWAPQVPILRHRAVGAFLTHCGWNSVMEGMAAGVPMLAWPMGADQFANATLLVDVLRVGRRVCEGDRTVPDSVELARAVAELIGEERAAEKTRAEELRKAAWDAVAEGGSSFRDLGELVRRLTELSLQASGRPD